MVHFVGAGPGAPDLITIRGAEILKEADVVIYAGSLVNPDLLSLCKEDCEIHNSAEMTLEEVLEVIAAAEAQQKTTVRLHTGDPSIYGAIREQMDALKENNIEYDVCPGVSAMQAAAAALKTEYTLPDVTQTVIVTRTEGRTPVPSKEQLHKLAEHDSTMVLFLSAGLTEKVREELLSGGRAPETPVAVVYRASWPDEKVIHTTVEDLPKVAERYGTAPAIIVVGDVLSEGSDFYDRSRLYDPEFTTGFRKGNKE